jgi:GSCFA family
MQKINMHFQTSFEIKPSKVQINLKSSILTIGSCFAEVVGNQLVDNKINVDVNPIGTVFNPSSIFKALNQSINKTTPETTHYLEKDGQWFHYDYHSKINSDSKIGLENIIGDLHFSINERLSSSDFVIVTLGTSFAYQLLETNNYVSNCHKMPGNLFRKDLLHVKHICQEFEHFYKNLKKLNLSIQIILTVSPVRHTKDGIPENQVSKSILRAACHYLVLDFDDVTYFPAYEIMMDELRDYRYYDEDMIHPNKIAEKYIFERFSKTYFSNELIDFVTEWQKLQLDLNHRPFNEKSESHQKFLKNLLGKLEAISSIVPVEKEKEAVLSRIFVK